MDSQTQLKKFNVFEAQGIEIKTKANDLIVKLPEHLTVANEMLKYCQTIERESELKRKEVIAPYNSFVKEVNDFVKEILKPTEESKLIIKSKILGYNEEQEKIRAEQAEVERKKLEEIRLAEEAEVKRRQDEERKIREAEEAKLDAIRKQQEEERKKIALEQDENKKKEMEIERRRLEEQAKIEEAKQEIEVKKREMEAEEKRIAEDRKRVEELKKIQEEKEKREQEEKENKVKGIRSIWKYDVTDENLVPREFCSPDSKKINEAIKKGITEIQGVKIYQSKDIR